MSRCWRHIRHCVFDVHVEMRAYTLA